MAEEAIRQHERMMSQAQRTAQVAGWEKDLQDLNDLNHNELRWSDEAYRICGYAPGTVKVTTDLFYSMVHPEDREMVAEAVKHAVQNLKPYEVEHRLIRPDGTERIVHQWGSVVTDSTGRPLRLLGTCQDVTERKMAEQAVRESEERYRALTDAVVQLMWVNDSHGRATFRNRRWFEYTGLEPVDQPSMRANIIHPDDYEVVEHVRNEAINDAKPYQIEYRLRRHDGQYRWHLGRVIPMTDEQGNVIRWFGTATDIHDMKLAEQQMLVARQEAEDANKAKDQFIAALSHELRTPLTPVVMTVAAMEMDRTLSPQMRDDLAMIRRNIELETKLIDDLLDVTRITNGKLRLQLRDTNVHELLNHVQQILNADVQYKRLNLTTNLSADDALVSADPARLQQIFWNLVKNAIKFTQPGGNIYIRTSNPGRHSMLIEVADDGAGIDEAVLPKIFNAFDQGEQAITRQFGGLGLGLTISKAAHRSPRRHDPRFQRRQRQRLAIRRGIAHARRGAADRRADSTDGLDATRRPPARATGGGSSGYAAHARAVARTAWIRRHDHGERCRRAHGFGARTDRRPHQRYRPAGCDRPRADAARPASLQHPGHRRQRLWHGRRHPQQPGGRFYRASD